MTLPTGEQFVLETTTASGELKATITAVSAVIGEGTINGIDLVPTFREDETPPSGAGIVLVPWPSRIRDGKWVANGVTHQLDITEVPRNTALHGLLRYTEYRMIAPESDSVTLTTKVYPRPGYPFLLYTAVHYELVADGLRVTHRIENDGADSAPVAIGSHPYLKIGGVATEDLILRLDAASHITFDERLPPIAEGQGWGLGRGGGVGGVDGDDRGGELPSHDGEVVSSLTAPDGRSVSMWAEPIFGYVQVYTSRDFPGESMAIAVEPMTAPAEAFNSGRGVRWLDPGEEWECSWGIRFAGFAAN